MRARSIVLGLGTMVGIVVGRTVYSQAVAVPLVPPPGAATASSGERIDGADRSLGDARAVVATPGTTPANAQDAKQLEQQKRQQRLQRLMQIRFDRRPSTILQEWSRPAGKKVDERHDSPPAPSEGGPPGMAQFAKEFDAEIEAFERSVTLGEWSAVRDYLASLPLDDGKNVYRQMLTMFCNPAHLPVRQGPGNVLMPPPNPGNIDPRLLEINTFDNQDLIELAAAAPAGLDDQTATLLGTLLRQATERGHDIQDFIQRMSRSLVAAPSESPLLGLWPARILTKANFAAEIGVFLPPIAVARDRSDSEALNLLAVHYLALNSRDDKLVDLEQAWQATQAILGLEEAPAEERDAAVTRAIDLVPRIRKELGEDWLTQSFTADIERGKQILASIGSLASSSTMTAANNPELRRKHLEFQRTVTETLLECAPELADAWRDNVTLLAMNWLREAEFSYLRDTSSASGPTMERDMYGNIFWLTDDDERRGRIFQGREGSVPIRARDALKLAPSEEWTQRINPSLHPRFHEVLAKLHLKVGHDDEAFPFIERLATTHRDAARTLVHEFLRVWTSNHDPNKNQRRRGSYVWFYGFEQRASGIPLTRSKQERNLKDLAQLVANLKRIDVGEIDEELIARAFMTCHSTAEVYTLDSIEAVFGALDLLKPKTVASLALQMRANLSGVWREPAVQEQAKTNRKQKDIEAEVLQGYAVATAIVDRAIQKHADEWMLQLVKAAIVHDFIDYKQSLEKSSDYVPARTAALAEFEKAAALYAKAAPELTQEQRSTQVYDLWFYASLGAVDLGQITEDRPADPRQIAKIRQAILDLPGELADWHMASFANALFTRMSNCKPAVKVRYVRAGLEIVGDHERAEEAREVFEYYEDLVQEIKLVARIDGSDVVGQKPFGVFIDLVHSREIEREAGGFAKYLQNQNSSRGYYYNYGRPLEDYRDKFQNAVKQALEEQFEVVSVTFNREDVHSKATGEYGWRVTPYAYLLLKAKGPQVDRVPSVQLDLDFLDTSGYVVLPIATAPVTIDAGSPPNEPRPASNIRVTQTLDERQAKDGKLILEVKATSHGLVPELDQILALAPEGFQVDTIDDQGASVIEFTQDTAETLVNSERIWQITLSSAPADGLSTSDPPKTFRFGVPRENVDEVAYQRYEDADLVAVGREVSLEKEYAKKSYAWIGIVVGGALAAVLIVLGLVLILRRKRPSTMAAFHVPEQITPFTVLGLLRTIDAKNGLAAPEHLELAQVIAQVEEFYFAEPTGPEPDLAQIAKTWVGRARMKQTSSS